MKTAKELNAISKCSPAKIQEILKRHAPLIEKEAELGNTSYKFRDSQIKDLYLTSNIGDLRTHPKMPRSDVLSKLIEELTKLGFQAAWTWQSGFYDTRSRFADRNYDPDEPPIYARDYGLIIYWGDA